MLKILIIYKTHADETLISLKKKYFTCQIIKQNVYVYITNILSGIVLFFFIFKYKILYNI